MYHGEKFNSISHLVGAIAAIVGGTALIVCATFHDGLLPIIAASIYAATLFLLYTISTPYHSVRAPASKNVLRKLDYISIYLLIAGSYTPYTLITLEGGWRIGMTTAIWVIAIVGIIQECLFAKGARILSLIIYLVMGWLVLIAIVPIIRHLPMMGLIFLSLGGVFYTIGVYWFINDEKIRHGHGIWHLFVLAGSVAQFISIFGWVI